MNPLKIGIVEDELLVARSISVLLKEIGYTPLNPARNYTEAIAMIKTDCPDLVLIDIILEGERDGIELAATINKEFHLPFIFLTANSDTATVSRAKEVNPYSYLVKPFYEKELYSSIEIAFSNYNERNKPRENKAESKFQGYIFIKEVDTFYKVALSDIIYLESDHVYLNIYTHSKKYLVRHKLDEFVSIYPSNFIRTHRSYAINKEFIDSINTLTVNVKGNEVPLSQNYRKQLLESVNIFR